MLTLTAQIGSAQSGIAQQGNAALAAATSALTVEQTLYNSLLADAGVAAIIGTRLYLVQLPQNPVYPAAVYQRISTQPLYSHSPDTGQQATFGWSRFSITCWASGGSGGATCEAFAEALTKALQTFNAWSASVTNFPNFVISRRMGIEPQTVPPLFTAVIDVKIWYRDQ